MLLENNLLFSKNIEESGVNQPENILNNSVTSASKAGPKRLKNLTNSSLKRASKLKNLDHIIHLDSYSPSQQNIPPTQQPNTNKSLKTSNQKNSVRAFDNDANRSSITPRKNSVLEPRFQRKIRKNYVGYKRNLIDSGESHEKSILKDKTQIEPDFFVLTEKIPDDTIKNKVKVKRLQQKQKKKLEQKKFNHFKKA